MKYHTDVLVPCKLHFFAFIASMFKPFLQIFQTNRPTLPFLLHELESLTNQLVCLVMRRDAIKEADTILKKLKEKWVKDVNNQLEEDLVDLGAATKDLTKTQISALKKQKFKNDCKQIVISIIPKLQERAPLKYCIIRNSSALSPKQMVLQSDEASVPFRSLTDKLYALQKIKAEIADKAKNQFEVFLKDSILQNEEEFKSFDFRKDHVDSFLATYFASHIYYSEVWHVYKLIFVLSHEQSPVKKEVLQDNLQEKYSVLQRLIYDFLCCTSNLNIEEFEIKKKSSTPL